MHSRDPGKQRALFDAEFERILRAAGEGRADFTKFVFPKADFNGREFLAECIFTDATFQDEANFREAFFRRGACFMRAVFKRGADFHAAKIVGTADFGEAEFLEETLLTAVAFIGEADFTKAAFARYVDWSRSTFGKGAAFTEASFHEEVDFHGVTFEGMSLFSEVVFNRGADFRRTVFRDHANFEEAAFGGKSNFSETIFSRDASFTFAEFKAAAAFSYTRIAGTASFHGLSAKSGISLDRSTFAQNADFSEAEFGSFVDFSEAEFKQRVAFERTAFAAVVTFWRAAFLGPVEYRKTKFRQDGTLCPGPIFELTKYAQPDAVVFHQTNLDQALFQNSDVSHLVFSNVRWRRRPGNRKCMVFEEVANLEGDFTEVLRPEDGDPDERNYSLIAELYQQLKKNYDDRRDYCTAGDFHYGEMEMKRLSSPSRSRAFRWLHRNFGLVALYKHASEYGESYVLPAVWLLVIVLAAGLLYPLARLRGSGIRGQTAQNVAMRTNEELGLAEAYSGHNYVVAVGVAFFQRDLPYEPSYPWGRVLSWFQLLLTSSLIALFLLALRRQFRR